MLEPSSDVVGMLQLSAWKFKATGTETPRALTDEADSRREWVGGVSRERP